MIREPIAVCMWKCKTCVNHSPKTRVSDSACIALSNTDRSRLRIKAAHVFQTIRLSSFKPRWEDHTILYRKTNRRCFSQGFSHIFIAFLMAFLLFSGFYHFFKINYFSIQYSISLAGHLQFLIDIRSPPNKNIETMTREINNRSNQTHFQFRQAISFTLAWQGLLNLFRPWVTRLHCAANLDPTFLFLRAPCKAPWRYAVNYPIF